MIDEKINDQEASQLKKINNHFLHKRTHIMKNTQFKVEDLFGYILGKECISSEQITKFNDVIARTM